MDDLKNLPQSPGSQAKPARKGGMLPWIVMLAVLGLVGFLVTRLVGRGTGRAEFAPPPPAVGVALATLADMQVIDAGLGTVSSLATVTVQTQIAGVMQTIGFKEGQIVHKGDFLAQIDPRPTQALLDQAKGTLAHDQGLLRQAQMDAARYAKLNRQDSIGRQQYEDQVYVAQQYEGSVAADQGAVATQQVNLGYCHITAPIAGRVGLRQVDAGNYVTPSSLANGIVVIAQIDPISVIFTLPEDDVPATQKRLSEGATLPVLAYDRSNTTLLATGTLETIDNQIDTTTGTVKLRALFANPDARLFPNQFVNAKLLVQTAHNALTVPNEAVQTGAPGSFVYAVEKGSDGAATVVVKKVKTGLADVQKTQILEGISAGDTVVVDGADRLRDGAAVMLPGNGGAETGGAAGHRHHKRTTESGN